MYITCNAYKELINKVPNHLPEVGGILGGCNNIIRYVIMDYGIKRQNAGKCYYIPDVKYLNKCIADWDDEKIDFYGMFHTHFFGVSTMSDGDMAYIEKIMQAMPDTKQQLYFPIVIFPERKLVSYVCNRNKEEIKIAEDSINLVNTR